jgi:hypothetical protein
VDAAQSFWFDLFGGHFTQKFRESFRQVDRIKTSAIFEKIAACFEKIVKVAMQFVTGDGALLANREPSAFGPPVGRIGNNTVKGLHGMRFVQFAQISLDNVDLFFELVDNDISVCPVGTGPVNLDPGHLYPCFATSNEEG